MLLAFLIGMMVMFSNAKFDQPQTLTFMQSIIMGLIISASTIIPGIDSSVLLSSLGLYEIYIESIATINFTILIPAVLGAGVGVLAFSSIINHLIKKHYTLTYSIIFGLFLSLVPSVINESVVIELNLNTLVSFIFLILGTLISYKLSMYSLEDE